MNLDDMTMMAFTRLTWRERLAVVHIELWHAVRRLLRREHRYFLTLDGKPLAKFMAATDSAVVLEWLTTSHTRATDYGVTIGRGKAVEQYLAQNDSIPEGLWEGACHPADAGPAGPA